MANIRNFAVGLILWTVLARHVLCAKLDAYSSELEDDSSELEDDSSELEDDSSEVEDDSSELEDDDYDDLDEVSNELDTGDIDANDTFVCRRIQNGGGGIGSERKGEGLQGQRKIRTLESKLEAMQRKLDTLLSSISPGVISLTYNTIPRDCVQLYDNGVRTDGIYNVSPDGRCPFEVYCDMTNGGWTTIQRRHTAYLHFNRTWEEYASGFGDLEKDFWLGLDKIHRLTASGSRIHFWLGRYGRRKDAHWAEYSGFVVHDVISGYAMNVDAFGYNGTLPELFSYHDGAKISTFDRDQDTSSGSCSEEMGGGGGWWYGACYRLGVLNGLFGEKKKGGNSYWHYSDWYIKRTEMKVKPLSGAC